MSPDRALHYCSASMHKAAAAAAANLLLMQLKQGDICEGRRRRRPPPLVTATATEEEETNLNCKSCSSPLPPLRRFPPGVKRGEEGSGRENFC